MALPCCSEPEDQEEDCPHTETHVTHTSGDLWDNKVCKKCNTILDTFYWDMPDGPW